MFSTHSSSPIFLQPTWKTAALKNHKIVQNKKKTSMKTSILCLILVFSSCVIAQDEFNKVLGVVIDKGCMESVLFMPKACEAGGTSDVFSNASL